MLCTEALNGGKMVGVPKKFWLGRKRCIGTADLAGPAEKVDGGSATYVNVPHCNSKEAYSPSVVCRRQFSCTESVGSVSSNTSGCIADNQGAVPQLPDAHWGKEVGLASNATDIAGENDYDNWECGMESGGSFSSGRHNTWQQDETSRTGTPLTCSPADRARAGTSISPLLKGAGHWHLCGDGFGPSPAASPLPFPTTRGHGNQGEGEGHKLPLLGPDGGETLEGVRAEERTAQRSLFSCHPAPEAEPSPPSQSNKKPRVNVYVHGRRVAAREAATEGAHRVLSQDSDCQAASHGREGKRSVSVPVALGTKWQRCEGGEGEPSWAGRAMPARQMAAPNHSQASQQRLAWPAFQPLVIGVGCSLLNINSAVVNIGSSKKRSGSAHQADREGHVPRASSAQVHRCGAAPSGAHECGAAGAPSYGSASTPVRGAAQQGGGSCSPGRSAISLGSPVPGSLNADACGETRTPLMDALARRYSGGAAAGGGDMAGVGGVGGAGGGGNPSVHEGECLSGTGMRTGAWEAAQGHAARLQGAATECTASEEVLDAEWSVANQRQASGAGQGGASPGAVASSMQQPGDSGGHAGSCAALSERSSVLDGRVAGGSSQACGTIEPGADASSMAHGTLKLRWKKAFARANHTQGPITDKCHSGIDKGT
eukprot:jgi/Mesvir1/17885/Mv12958-RA.1